MRIYLFLIILLSGHAMAEEVEVLDVETGKVTKVLMSTLGPEMVRVESDGIIYWANVHQLQESDYRHEPFKGDRKKDVEFIKDSLSEVNSNTYVEWEDGFRRDENPDKEIEIWKYIISVYSKYSNIHDTPEQKNDIYLIAVTCSYSSQDVVLGQLTLKSLDIEKAKEIIGAYYKKET
jgi:hypothetical protein